MQQAVKLKTTGPGLMRIEGIHAGSESEEVHSNFEKCLKLTCFPLKFKHFWLNVPNCWI